MVTRRQPTPPARPDGGPDTDPDAGRNGGPDAGPDAGRNGGPAGGATADVVVVGAGPAGAVAGLLLARQGHDVILIDRETFPRPKACGDCLSAGATDLLAGLGLLDTILDAGPARLEGWQVVAPDGVVSAGSFRGAMALAMERRLLDQRLVEAAVAAGVRFVRARVEDLARDPVRGRVRGVTGRGPDGGAVRYTARLVVGADGLRSVVAGRLGLVQRGPRLRKVSLTTRLHLPALDLDHGEMHVLDGACVGFAPIGRSRFNLTLVVTAARAGSLGRIGPDAFFRQWLARAPSVHDRVGGADLPELSDLMASGPFDRPVRSATADGAALVGDAAGYYDPFTGQGVYRAMADAVLLADTVGPRLRSGDLAHGLRTYARQRRRLAVPARRLQRLIELILARPATADIALRRLARAPAVMDRLVAVTGDLEPPGSLFTPGMFSKLLWPTPTESR